MDISISETISRFQSILDSIRPHTRCRRDYPTADTANMASLIDHTLLKADATEKMIGTLCEEARKYRFKSVCVNPQFVALASQGLAGSSVLTCTVVGFPLGAVTTATKAFETENAIKNGATEIDMVLSIGRLKSCRYNEVWNDIAAVAEAAGALPVKVIIETCLLTDEEKIIACWLAKDAGATFVKTSTGFSTAGATLSDIKLMRESVGAEMGVKASGGIRSREDALAMIEAGATRIGTSNGVAIVNANGGPTSHY